MPHVLGISGDGMEPSRSITFILLSTVVIAVLTMASTYSVQDPFSIAISTPQIDVKVGSEVRIRIVLTNVSSHEMDVDRAVSESQGELNYVINAYDVDGKPLPDTDYGRAAKNKEVIIVSRHSLRLKPTEKVEEDAVLNNLYDISRPGQYAIQVERKIPEKLGGGVVKSNTITITVTP